MRATTSAPGARHGIEYAYPLLDRCVLEFALGLPPGVCSNRDKRDPVRLEPFRAAAIEALPELRRTLDTRSASASRSRYVNVPRLKLYLDAGRFQADGRRRLAVRALRLLDF